MSKTAIIERMSHIKSRKAEMAQKDINRYIDLFIIEEYSSLTDLSVYSDLTPYEQKNFIEFLCEHDAATKDFLFDRMQFLVDSRAMLAQSQRNYDRGLTPLHDDQTGETVWRKSA